MPMALRIFVKRIGEFLGMPERIQQGWIDNQLFLRLVKGDLPHTRILLQYLVGLQVA